MIMREKFFEISFEYFEYESTQAFKLYKNDPTAENLSLLESINSELAKKWLLISHEYFPELRSITNDHMINIAMIYGGIFSGDNLINAENLLRLSNRMLFHTVEMEKLAKSYLIN